MLVRVRDWLTWKLHGLAHWVDPHWPADDAPDLDDGTRERMTRGLIEKLEESLQERTCND